MIISLKKCGITIIVYLCIGIIQASVQYTSVSSVLRRQFSTQASVQYTCRRQFNTQASVPYTGVSSVHRRQFSAQASVQYTGVSSVHSTECCAVAW